MSGIADPGQVLPMSCPPVRLGSSLSPRRPIGIAGPEFCDQRLRAFLHVDPVGPRKHRIALAEDAVAARLELGAAAEAPPPCNRAPRPHLRRSYGRNRTVYGALRLLAPSPASMASGRATFGGPSEGTSHDQR